MHLLPDTSNRLSSLKSRHAIILTSTVEERRKASFRTLRPIPPSIWLICNLQFRVNTLCRCE
ncbi:hypothetical protein I7I48_05469 [Histoplasma ohiense]|nr:hypothetical protein I7I48_05469 [Histoplasma ohiense (nom. inval.)]